MRIATTRLLEDEPGGSQSQGMQKDMLIQGEPGVFEKDTGGGEAQRGTRST